MSRTYSKFANKHEKHPKVRSQQYLYSADEPREYSANISMADLELLEDTESMRQGFRHLAREMRNR